MKKVSFILFLLAFAIGIVFYACSTHDGNIKCSIDTPAELCVPENSSNSGFPGYSSSEVVIPPIYSSNDSEPPIIYSSESATETPSSSSEPSEEPDYSSESATETPSSSSRSNQTVSSSSSSLSSSSKAQVSSSSVNTTPTCVYKTDWCGGAAASSVKTASLNNATGSGICTFATSAAMLGNFNNATVNGQKIDKCGNSGWGQQPCTTVLGSVTKADGGYYIYAPDYYADFTTTGGTPNCNSNSGNPTPNPGVSSSATWGGNSSNSGGGGTSSNSGNGGGNGTPSYTPTSPGNESGQTTQYWDACKPSCSWSGKGGKQSNACDISGKNIGHKDSDKSACDGGPAFTCMNQAPWKVGNVSFGFVAVNDGQCGDCYQLNFPNGEVMVVMKTNIGGINGKFDIMIPGGGVGDFDALTRQVQNSGVSNADMGARYGGFRLACNNSVSCVRDKCNSVFKNLPDLKDGCLWYVNTLGNSPSSFDNPRVQYKKVDCPRELLDRY